jgi:hypothetical protein
MLVVISFPILNVRRDSASGQDLSEIARLANVEHDDRNIVVAAQRHSGGVHDLEVVAQDLAEGQGVVTGRASDLLGVGVIDAVDARPLEQRIAAHFGGAQRRCRVGREVRIPGPGREEDDPALFDVTKRAAADVGLRHTRHRNRRLDASVDAELLERALERDRVHHRGEHAHVIRAGAVEPFGCSRHAAEDVASADHQAEFRAMFARCRDLAGEAGDRVRVDAELARPHQRLAGKLQQDPVEARASHGGKPSLR